MRCDDGQLLFRPQLPPGIVGLSFRLRYRGRLLHVSVRGGKAEYCLLSGEPLALRHYDSEVTVEQAPTSLDIPACAPLASPAQPAGREPLSRRSRS
jgi:alpha,alpha-trehalose phosphorylase